MRIFESVSSHHLLFAGALCLALFAGDEPDEIVLGEGEHQWRWVSGWGGMPEGADYGNTHGSAAVDAAGNIYVNTDTEHAVVVLSPEGEYVRSFGGEQELAGGLHSMQLVSEGVGEESQEFLYMTHHARHEVVKTTLEGEVVWRLGYPEESGKYGGAGEYRPTGIAVRPDGGFYVADGYGKSWIHQYDAERNYLRSFGGPGSEPGQFRTPHGLWLDLDQFPPRLLIADRENHRVQVFTPEGEFVSAHPAELRRPCGVARHGDLIAVPDLAGRVTILNAELEPLVHLGDQPDPDKRARNGIPFDQWRDGEFLSPHGLGWDSDGNLFVVDWNAKGRFTKLERVE